MFRVLLCQNLLAQTKWKVLQNPTPHKTHFAGLGTSLRDARNGFLTRKIEYSEPWKVPHVNHGTLPNAKLLRLLEKKMKKVRKQKYAELVQVTDSETIQMQTAVQKLKAKKLSDFVSTKNPIIKSRAKEPRMVTFAKNSEEAPIIFVDKNMDIFDEEKLDPEIVNHILASYYSYKEGREDPVKEAMSRECETELGDVEHKDESEIMKVEPIKVKKKKTKQFHSQAHKTAEEEAKAKRFCIIANLSSYLDLCVSTGMLNRGLSTILSYRYRFKNISSTFLDISLYNILLHGFAEVGDLPKIKEIHTILVKDKLFLNAQSYAAMLECIGRMTVDGETKADHLKFLKTCFKEAESQNITLNDIMTKSVFVRDQWDIALEVAREVEPGFNPVFTPPEVHYKNQLLSNLNEGVFKADSTEDPFLTNNPSEIVHSSFNKTQLNELAVEQLRLEVVGSVSVKSIEKFPPPTASVINLREKLMELQDLWKAQICAAYNRDVKTLQAQTNSKGLRNVNLLPYLKTLDANQYAEILLKEIRKLAEGSETYSPTVGQLYRQLGVTVQHRFHLEQRRSNGLEEKTMEIYDKFLDKSLINRSSCLKDNNRQIWQKLVYHESQTGPSMTWNETPWPHHVTICVGRFLYNILMRDLKVDLNAARLGNRPQQLTQAFYTLYRNQARSVKEEVKPHPVVVKLFRDSQQENLSFPTNLVPMLCPPQPWSTPISGGYLLVKSDLIRLPQHANQQLKRVNEGPGENLYPALDSLNQLASVPWTVNQEILDVILEVFNNNGSDELGVPRPPSELVKPQMDKDRSLMSGEEKMKLFKEKMSHHQKQAEMYSLWCDCLYRLSLANHFRDKIFWLPHNMDFRGRVYPLPPHLNHLGSDLARSMLQFHEKRPLGVDGFRWLKLHCINLTGLKKRDSVDDRLKFADFIFDEILDSADRPLTGGMWWAKSDEPWQTLACCIEIAKAHRHPNKEQYLSRFPIHQDGSCNGLQHYAALGRDSAGAISVNLAPSPVPQDVYSAVAALVDGMREKDAENGEEVAKILEGFVRRKVIKQTVMTTVYGVTRFGARLQIARQLKNIDQFPQQWVWPASLYLTTKTFESLREMFTSTKEIQDWFTDCARQISSVCSQNVEWVTPLGLPVVQPYNRFTKRYTLKSHTVQESFSVDTFERPNVVKQKNAFPPNFIHSLDSSHMMLTSLNCERKGMTFISVHDCFWTHACTVPTMNEITRTQFVALHSQPILEDLSEFLQERYCFSEGDIEHDGSTEEAAKRKLNKILRKLPDTGDFDLNNVLKSVYFFS